MNLSLSISFAALLGVAFFGNLPLGYLREGCQKFSVRWFVYIHLSIPFIIALRIIEGFGLRVIPFTIGCAVAGQLIGGRVRRRKRT